MDTEDRTPDDEPIEDLEPAEADQAAVTGGVLREPRDDAGTMPQHHEILL